MKKIVIAPNSFKESLSSVEVADIIEAGFKKVLSQSKHRNSFSLDKVPLSDGGDGTLEVILSAGKGKIYTAKVRGPSGTTVIAKYGILGDRTAVVELAKASGIALVPPKLRNPLYTTTYGTGELIKEAVAKKAKKIILCVGGSSTCDGGIGILSALGVKFEDKKGREITNPVGKSLIEIHKIDTSALIKLPELIVAYDVSNPLLGKNGSARIYGPQKGAGRKEVELLDKGLLHFSDLMPEGNKYVGTQRAVSLPGMGAAGGVPFGLMLIKAKMAMGTKLVMQLAKFEERAKNADLIITGEGEINESTRYGKVVWEVMKFGKAHNISVIGITAKIGKGIDDFYEQGLTSIVSLTPKPVSLKVSICNAQEFLMDTSIHLAHRLLAGT